MDPELDDEGRNGDGGGGDGVVCESGGMGWWGGEEVGERGLG